MSHNSWTDTSTTLPSRQIEIGRPSRNSRFEAHFSAFPKGQFENIRRRFSHVSHIAQPKLDMRLALLYGVCEK